MLDLIFFFITSARFEVFSVHRDALLDHYVGSLNETLTKVACNCMFTRADLDRDLEKYKVLFPYLISRRLQLVVSDESSVGSDENSSNNYLSILAKWLNYFVESGIV